MKNGLLALMLMLVMMLLAACQSSSGYRVNVLTDPPGAVIAIAKNEQPFTKRGNQSPYTKSFLFSEKDKQYRIQARPQGRLAETHKITEIVLNEEILAEAKGGDEKGAKPIQYPIKLEPRPWIDMRSNVLIFDPVLGWRGFETKDRAYAHKTGDNGESPEKVIMLLDKDDSEFDGFRGVSLSPDGEKIVVSRFKLDDPEVYPTNSELKKMKSDGEDVSKYVPRMEWLRPIKSSKIRADFIKGPSKATFVRDGVNFDPWVHNDGESLLYVAKNAGDGTSRLYNRPRIGSRSIAHYYEHNPDEATTYPSIHGRKDSGEEVKILFNIYPMNWTTLAEMDIRIDSSENASALWICLGIHPRFSPRGDRIAHIFENELRVITDGGMSPQTFITDTKGVIERYGDSLKDSEEDTARWENYERDRLFLPNSYPTWTPDGKWLVYTSMSVADETGRPQQDIFAMNSEKGSSPMRLTTNPSADRMPMISPDGKTLYFVSNREKVWAVWKTPLPKKMQP